MQYTKRLRRGPDKVHAPKVLLRRQIPEPPLELSFLVHPDFTAKLITVKLQSNKCISEFLKSKKEMDAKLGVDVEVRTKKPLRFL
jgi:hypothetical protein